jgi:hypothetical protein
VLELPPRNRSSDLPRLLATLTKRADQYANPESACWNLPAATRRAADRRSYLGRGGIGGRGPGGPPFFLVAMALLLDWSQ